jgi:glycerol-3-phosphate cytidylyltransferase
MSKYPYGYTAGSFDGLHIGHLNLLKKAKDQCEWFIVAVSTDELIEVHKKIKPIVPLNERMELIKALKCVDQVVVQKELLNLQTILKYVPLDGQVFLGSDWKNRDELSAIKILKHNKMITFFPYTKEVSSSLIKERIINNAEAILKAKQERAK